MGGINDDAPMKCNKCKRIQPIDVRGIGDLNQNNLAKKLESTPTATKV